MLAFPNGIKFLYNWRSYQENVLSELDHHLKNRHLHLIAPPGSGKTVLGLEVMLRINQPTLILAPTLAIKHQWYQRFLQLFLQTDQAPNWISMNLKNPKFLTITTYQSLHALLSRQKHIVNEDIDEEEIFSEDINVSELINLHEKVVGFGFRTLILDEAHHLRTEWWKSTIQFRDHLVEPSIAALTATPPYDVSLLEWERYIQLCGPIDLEINVPELVKAQDLCPHQDYIYFSTPNDEEEEIITFFRENVQLLTTSLLKSQGIEKIIESHPWILSPYDHLEEILSSPTYFTSLLIYLEEVGNTRWKELLHIIGMDNKNIPPINLQWMEEFLTGILYQDPLIDKENIYLKQVKKELKRIGAIDKRKICLQSNKKLDRTLIQSVSKLNSILEIIKFERKEMKKQLRIVILTDFIRLPDLPKNKQDVKPLTRIGVIPIFETLRRNQLFTTKLGVLSGSIVILPETALSSFLNSPYLEKNIQYKRLPHDSRYISIQVAGAHNQHLVRIMTDLFTKGEIQVLIGTTSLLGEGWDAPCINSIILASYVGTFMLSNQMRGRAIRVEPENKEKTANVWHLVCIDSTQKEQGQDFYTLSRRFQSFVGIAYEDDVIENGINRLNIEIPPYNVEKIKHMNEKTFAIAKQRNKLKERWNSAFGEGKNIVKELKSSKEIIPKEFVYKNTIRALLLQAMGIGLSVTLGVLESLESKRNLSLDVFLIVIASAIVLGVIATLPKTIKALRLLIKHGSFELCMKEMGEVVVNTLNHMKLLQTDITKLKILTDRDKNGFVYCWMVGGTNYEKSLFIDTLQEFMNPIENPRYLLLTKRKKGLLNQLNYYPIPQTIGKNKVNTEFFHQQWGKKVGKAELIYTRTLEGRKILIKARMKAMSSAFIRRTERKNTWR